MGGFERAHQHDPEPSRLRMGWLDASSHHESEPYGQPVSNPVKVVNLCRMDTPSPSRNLLSVKHSYCIERLFFYKCVGRDSSSWACTNDGDSF
jgi:hypothetical protein